MKEVKRTLKKLKYVEIEDGTQEVIEYFSDDGKIRSTNKNDILRYEEKLEFEKIEHMPADSNLLELGTWYRLKDEKEKEMFMRNYGFTDHNNYMEYLHLDYEDIDYWDLNLPLNEWFAIQYSDGGDHRSSYYIYSLKYIKDDLQRFLSKVGVK